MKVIHFIGSIDKLAGGTTAYMQLLAKELQHYTELIIAAGMSEKPVKIEGVKTHFFDISLKNALNWEKEFTAFLKLEKPDLVHINGIWMPQLWIFQKAAQKQDIKVILTPHGMLEPYILNRHPLKKKIALALYQDKAIKRANIIHATANSELQQIQKLGYNQQAAIIPNGVDLSEINTSKNWENKSNQTFNILFLSRVHPKKGIEFLINAIAQIKNPKIQITIAGEGNLEYINSLKKLSKSQNVDNQFNFIGGIYGNKKWELYQNSDLFVLPTYSENFGIVIAEALAVGLPVITTTGTPWNELNDFNCGWWIDLTVENLVNTINHASGKNIDELKIMGENGQKLIKEKYDIKAIAKQFYELYKNHR